MKPQTNQPKAKDTDNITNKDNTEEHNTDHKTLLRPKAGALSVLSYSPTCFANSALNS